MLKTSEWVSIGHPDKVADAISCYLLDRYLEQDPNTRFAVEVQIKDNFVTLGGEITSKFEMDESLIAMCVRDAVNKIGYTRSYQNLWGKENTICGDELDVVQHLGMQSGDIAQGVNASGWGDQGIFWGMAVNDPSTGYMPTDWYLAQKIGRHLYDNRLGGIDIKTQVTMDDGKIEEVIVAIPLGKHNFDYDIESIVRHCCGGGKDFSVIVNGTGKYVKHGPIADCGTTGRKLAVDFYGGNCRIGGGCVDGETEYLSPSGWKKIKDYDGGEVGQVDDGMHLSFAMPERYIKTFSNDVYDISMNSSLSMVLSGNHNVFYRTSKGNFCKKPLTDLLNESSLTSRGSHAEIPRFFEYDFPNGVKKFLPMEARLLIAHCADGTVYGKCVRGKFNCRISVKRERKIQRLHWILKSIGIEYTAKEYNDGFTRFYYHLDNPSKLLSEHFANPDLETAKLLAEEVLLWDGSEKYGEYRTTKKADADFMQFIFSAVSGKSYSLITREYDEPGHSTCYMVRGIRNKYSSPFRKTVDNRGHITKLDAQNVYCFTMPTGLLLLRRKNYIFVTGNSPWTKDWTKADLTLNVMARRLALEYIMIHQEYSEVHCAISCRIGSPEIRISYFDKFMNELDHKKVSISPLEAAENYGLRNPLFFHYCMDGLLW